MNKHHLRLFLAVDLDSSTRQSLFPLLNSLCFIPGIKTVKKGQAHLTLLFLGDVAQDLVPDLSRELRTSLSTEQVFVLSTGDFGTFPPKGHPRVVWLGISEGKENLVRLHHLCRAAIGPALLAEEQTLNFYPHITLARISSSPNPPQQKKSIKEFLTKRPPVAKQTVTSVTLYKSTLSALGAIHEKLEEFPLAN